VERFLPNELSFQGQEGQEQQTIEETMTGVEDDKDASEQINYSFPWIFKGGRERTGPDDGLSTLHQQPEQLWSSWRPMSPSSSESHNNSFFNNPQSFADMRMAIGSRTSGFKLSWRLLFLKGSTLPMPTVSNVKAEQVIRSPTPTPGYDSGATATTMVTLERRNERTMPPIPLDVAYGRAFKASTKPATAL
jgi:hypothetical protein